MSRDVRDLYRQEFGADALARQEQAARERHACCWEPNTGPHHPVCPNYVPPEVPAVHEAQESLL